jgi:hypothetical protein
MADNIVIKDIIIEPTPLKVYLNFSQPDKSGSLKVSHMLAAAEQTAVNEVST